MQLSVYPVLADVGTRFIELAGTGLWPSNWPLALQLALALLIADFGAYWMHRFMHTNRIGWRMHALHHSTQRLHFLASGRAHPFNAFLTLSCETGLLVMLGIPSGTLILFMVFKAVNGLLQHSNIDLRPGLLNYVFATNDVHRWHHSDNQLESSKNFGNTTMIWDHIFGSLIVRKNSVRRILVSPTHMFQRIIGYIWDCHSHSATMKSPSVEVRAWKGGLLGNVKLTKIGHRTDNFSGYNPIVILGADYRLEAETEPNSD